MLRDYQKNAITEIENSKEKNILLCMATGSGKTFTFCELAKRFIADNPIAKVLILVHRDELLQQAKKSLGERCFLINKGVKQIDSDFDYFVGMVETVNRRLKKIPDFQLVIIDECHIGNFYKMPFFDDKNVKVVGVTATPVATEPLAKYYQKMIIPVEIDDLVNDNFLVKSEVYAPVTSEMKTKKFKTKGGDFDDKEMGDFYSSEKMVINVVENYWKFIKGQKTIIFNVNIQHNNAVYHALKNEQLNVYRIDGATPTAERKEIIDKFKSQQDAIMCNVGVLTAGFDDPSIRFVILNRATKSLSLYLQMVGRGARPFANKEHFTVIDLGQNTNRFGFYEDKQDWHKYFTEGSKKESDTVGVAPTKDCPSCNYVNPIQVNNCRGCGFDFKADADAKKEAEVKYNLEKLAREKPINIPMKQLFDLAKERNYKPYAVLWKIAEHIVKYEKRYQKIVTKDLLNKFKDEHLQLWCDNYKLKKNNYLVRYLEDCIEKTKEKIF